MDDKIYADRNEAEKSVTKLMETDKRMKAYRIKEVTILPKQ
ncbi:hypothetical protein [Laceyella putida]|uniref:Uncharacterized protein n=1 Tax=Laceyella putida TaxID=110101 RepID=A0ABW2RJ12_9BACL